MCPKEGGFLQGHQNHKGLIVIKRLYLLLLFLPIISFFILVHAEKIEVYDKDWNLKYRVEDNNRVYDRDWNLRYRIEKDRIYDSNWNLKYRISDDRIYDRDWNLKGRIKDDRIYDRDWNLKARIKKDKRANHESQR